MDRENIYSFMTGCGYGVVSSVAADGSSQSALVGIAVTPGLDIIFDTLDRSRKYRNLVALPACSLVGWSGEQTVQYEGVAGLPAGAELKRYQEIYFGAWPDGPSRMTWAGMVYFVVRPRWIRYSDFEQRQPFIHETTFP